MYLFGFPFKHKGILCFTVAFLCFANSPSNAATLAFNNGFESGNLSGFSCSGNCPSVATSPTASGKYSGNFVLTPSMSTKYRTEVVLGSKGQFDFGKEYWFGFDYRYEDWAKDDSPETGPFQMHSRPKDWTNKCSKNGANRNRSPLIMTSKNGEVTLLGFNSRVLWKGPIQTKKWINIKVHLRVSHGSDGFIEAWKDGVKVGRINGANYPKSDACGQPLRSPFIKFGIYKWEWKRQNTDSNRRQLFIDNLKIATGSNGLSLVGSGANSASSVESTSGATSPTTTSPTTTSPTRISGEDATISAISDNRYTGQLVNGALLANEGVEFDGVDDYLNVGKQDVAGSAMTITGWILADRLSNCSARDCRIISKATGTATQDHYFMVSTIAEGSQTRLRFRLKTNGKTSTLIAGPGNVPEDKWIHVAAVYDGSAMRLYQNGVKVGSASKTGSITPNSDVPVWVGGNPPNAKSRPWKGWIDDLSIHNYALTDAEIAELASK